LEPDPVELDFQKHLRAALNHLYNPEQLRLSPLIQLFQINDRFDAPAVLQRILIDAIEALRPRQNEPLHSDKRKVYDLLLYRYIQQFKQEEVAHHLGVSDRQFRREQDHSLELLALSLWDKYGPEAEPSSSSKTEAIQANGLANIQKEWEWLKKTHSERITDLAQFTHKILDLMRAVGQQNSTELELIFSEPLPDLAVHPIAFRQILLNLLQVAIHSAGGGKVQVEIVSCPPFVEFALKTSAPEPLVPDNHQAQDASLVAIAGHLSLLSGGRLTVSEDQDGFACHLALPPVDGLRVLVIDDNNEIIELLQRYTTGTRYNVVGCNDPELALELAETTGALIIVLDVMMPKIDGWELLGRMRSHPRTTNIPVIVLSILAQEDLAFSLGARKLVMKPVTQEVFLAALDEVLSSPSSESR
jgi:CheY-like chemotaxis protein